MKQIAILFLAFTAFAACGTNFLRNLAASVTGVTLGDESTCVTEAPTKAFVIQLTFSEGLAKYDVITAKFQPDVTSPAAANVFEYGYKETAATGTGPKTITLSSVSSSSTALPGTYKLADAKFKSTTALALPTNSLTYTPEFSFKKESQTAAQKVDTSKDDAKTFVVKFEAAFTEVPKIFPNTTATTAVTCSAAEDKKSVTCTPNSSVMEDGKDYKIAYQKACDGEKVETGITVSYSAASFTKYSFLLLGLFLL